MDSKTNFYNSRQSKLAQSMQVAGLDLLALNPGPSLVYLTGLHFHLSERPVLFIFSPRGESIIVLPELEAVKLQGLSYPLQAFLYGEDPKTWAAAFKNGIMSIISSEGLRVGVEPRQLRFLELRLLEGALGHSNIVSAEEIVASLRVHKDKAEIAAMVQAVEIAQQALLATLPFVHAGKSEKELAAELVLQTLRAGSDPELPFMPIVSTGPNSANPHAVPTSRQLQSGDLLVIDWGACWNGYYADLTRTFAIGKVDAEMKHIAEIVLEANTAGRAAACVGAECGMVDAAARSVIEHAGYGRYFTHRTGHGLGMESHEEPYMRAGNPMLLAPGMTFTIEPGIYLPGRNGVRIEDNLVITENGTDCLSSLPRELLSLE